MDATKKNEMIAVQIINLLAENDITLNDAYEILAYTKVAIGKSTIVQPCPGRLFKTSD